MLAHSTVVALDDPGHLAFVCDSERAEVASDNQAHPPKRTIIFESYAWHDAQEIARRLRRDFEARGFDVWLDVERMRNPDRWSMEIVEAIDRADLVLALLSPQAVRTVASLDSIDGQDSGVDLNSDPSRARGPGRRRQPRSRCLGLRRLPSGSAIGVSDRRRTFRFSLRGGGWLSRHGSRGMALGRWQLLLRGRAGREVRGVLRSHPARNWMALSALILMAPSRAREDRSGADRRALGSLQLRRRFLF